MEDTREQILKELLKTPYAKQTSNKEQISVRCRFCGDSIRDETHTHMYVGYKINSNLLGYHCKKCLSNGIVKKDFLKLYDIDTTNFIFYLKDIKNSIRGLKRNLGNSTILINNYEIPKEILKEDKNKIDYINSRLARKITKEDIQKYKIVLNINQFIKHNKIDIFKNRNEDKEYFRKLLNEYSINSFGFLSFDNNNINIRTLPTSKLKSRYFNLQIDVSFKNPSLYTIKKDISIMSIKPKIVLTEGPFDIIGVKERYFLDDDTDSILASCQSKNSYAKALNQIMKITGFIDAEIRIYSDSDVSIDFYKDMFKDFIGISDITIIYNELYKDFGDLNEDTQLKIYKL